MAEVLQTLVVGAHGYRCWDRTRYNHVIWNRTSTLPSGFAMEKLTLEALA
jgi:hypothetical protein